MTTPTREPKGSFIRWQSTTIEQLTFSVNLVLGLSVAALGFQVTLLINPVFEPTGWQKVSFGASLVLLVISVGLGLWCVITRLFDFRATTNAARLRENGAPFAEIKPYRELYIKLGERTWTLFGAQIGTFGVGILLGVLAFCELLGAKLS